jgi:branched-chain amino acid aminotransferase
MGLPVKEALITRDQLYIADEVFISGTAAEVVSVREIDYRTIGEGRPGPVARALADAFYANVHGNGTHSKEWLDYVSNVKPQPAD